MNRILYSRKLWLPVIVLLTGLISVLLYINYETIIYNWWESLNLIVAVIGIGTTLFNYWKRFNIFFTRIFIILTNSTSIWNVSSNFEGDFNWQDFNNFIDKMRVSDSVSEYFEVSDTVIKMSIEGLNYTFEYVDIENDEGTDTRGKLYCRINDFNSSYDYSIKIMEETIIPNFSNAEKSLRPDNTTFNFKISFKGKNPFIRLITKNVNSNTVSSLWYTFQEETVAGKRSVRVTDKAIECTTSNLTDFQRSSTNFISLVGE